MNNECGVKIRYREAIVAWCKAEDALRLVLVGDLEKWKEVKVYVDEARKEEAERCEAYLRHLPCDFCQQM